MAFAHLTLATRSLPRAVAFFRDVLGWQPIERPGNIGRPAAWLRITPGQELHLLEVGDFEPSPFEGEFGRHVAFTVPAADFEGLRDRLGRHGAELIAPAREAGVPRFFFRDPDGYFFEVVAEQPAGPA